MKTIKMLCILFITMSMTVCAQVKTRIMPQKLYCGTTGCSAKLPDYRPQVVATDNCELASLVQFPAPGLVLSNKLRNVNVTIKATDNSGNATLISFPVSLIDTIAPGIIVNPTLVSATLDQIDRMYDIADRSMAYMMDGIARLDTIAWPMAKEFRDSAYYKQNMVIWTTPAHAIHHGEEGTGRRYWTFGSFDSTLIKRQ